MEQLKKKILEEGCAIGDSIVKVDGFLNHQIDVAFLEAMGREFKNRFAGVEVTKILTVEASGIAIAVATAGWLGYPKVIFAKKAAPSTMTEGFYSAEAKSFTKGTTSLFRVSESFLQKDDKVLILDDFLASGEASVALAEIVEAAGAQVVGIGAVIEKQFQGGSQRLRELGYRVESLAVVEKIQEGRLTFA